MLEKLMWDADFSVGNEELDGQHKHLLTLLNVLAECAGVQGDELSSRYHEALNDFADYLRHHFATEERLLAGCAYPELDEHKKAHLSYQTEFIEFFLHACQRKLDKFALHEFISTWLAKHVIDTDMKYKGYI